MTTRIPERESGFQRAVIDLARLRGWLVFHARPAQTQSGRWATPIMGDPGFPDLVMARRGRVIFAELKAERGRTGEAQHDWLDALGGIPCCPEHTGTHTVYLWRPSDFDEIEEELK